MPSINRIEIMGHVGREPELRHTTNGTAVCDFSVATSEKWGGEKRTEWHSVTAWKGWAEVAVKTLKVGSLVYVEGRVETQEWEKDGEKRRKTVIQAAKVYHLRDAHPLPDTTKEDGEGLPF